MHEESRIGPWYLRIQNIDKRIIYMLMFVVFTIPLMRPLKLPLNMSPGTKAAFEIIDGLPEGSIVFHAVGISASADAEVWPQMVALSQHYMKKRLRIIYFPTTLEGGMYINRVLSNIAPKYGYKYGEDLVALPFKAGGEPVIAGLKDFYSLYTTDVYGKDLKDLPVLQGFRGMEDVAVLVINTVGDDVNFFVRHIESAFGTTMVAAGAATVLPVIGPYLASGQVKAAISGISGAAEYELLADVPGKAMGAMDAQSMGHLLIIILIFLGNLGFHFQRRRKTFMEVG